MQIRNRTLEVHVVTDIDATLFFCWFHLLLSNEITAEFVNMQKTL